MLIACLPVPPRAPLKHLSEPNPDLVVCPSAAALLSLSSHRIFSSSGRHWLLLISVITCKEGAGTRLSRAVCL